MKKSELIARYMHFNEDITVITTKEFFDLYRETAIGSFNSKPAKDADCMKMVINGWEYYNYSACYTVGIDGDKDCDSFQFKIKRMTKEDKIALKKIFSQDNEHTEFDECINGEFSV